MEPNTSPRVPRVLILGSAGHGKLVTEYLWSEIPEDINIADYQVLIMDFTSLVDPETAMGVDVDRLPPFSQFAKFMFSMGSEIIVIGNKDFRFGKPPRSEESGYWLPRLPTFDYDQGETILLLDQSFEYYMTHVQKWAYCLRLGDWFPHKNLPAFISEAGLGKVLTFDVNLSPIAVNRYKRQIAFRANFKAGSFESGNLIWLPPTTDLSSADAIMLILKERYHLYSGRKVPEWISRYPVPSEVPIRERIEITRNVISDLTRELESLEQKLKDGTNYHKLLYEFEESILGPVVRDALSELGGGLDEPGSPESEDDRLKDPMSREYMVAIRGHEGPLQLKDINDLAHRVSDMLILKNKLTKGLLVCNLQCNLPPAQRVNIFPRNCVIAANNTKICLLTTTQIYNAIRANQSGTFSRKKFWDTISLAEGPCGLPELGE